MLRNCLFFSVILATAACNSGGLGDLSSFGTPATAIHDTENRDYYPSDHPIVVGKSLFRQQAYGRAFTKFRIAINAVPNDPAAWLGFAASSDMLGRFEDSDRAYRKLKPMIGNRIEFYNNYGYSLLLRGDLMGARQNFLKAYEIDPANEISSNNLALLRNSVNYPKRAGGDLRGL